MISLLLSPEQSTFISDTKGGPRGSLLMSDRNHSAGKW